MAAHSSECSVSVFWGFWVFSLPYQLISFFPLLLFWKMFLSVLICCYYYDDDFIFASAFWLFSVFPGDSRRKRKKKNQSRFSLLGGDLSRCFSLFFFSFSFLSFAGVSVRWCGLSSAWTEAADWLSAESCGRGGRAGFSRRAAGGKRLSVLPGPCCRS